MSEWIRNAISTVGYPGIALLMLAENLFPPIPSEVIMPFAGLVAARGPMSLVGVILAGTIGSVMGTLPLYFLGRKMGEERLREWADQHGRWLGVSGEDVAKARGWFDRHGAAVVLFGRLLPGVRSLISIPAGADQMNLGTYLLFTTLGAGIWTALLAYLGRLLGNNYTLVDKYLGPAAWIILGGIVALFLFRAVKHGRLSPQRTA